MPLQTIAQEIDSCTRCDLHRHRHRAVPGEGPGEARIMLVGEGPGREEDLLGRPFVGRSGRILDEILARAGFAREDLFITSVVKCRPPNNRVPRKREYETCIQAHLWRQIDALDPVIICLLGRVAAEALLGVSGLSEIRGKIFRKGEYRFFPTYHPAAAGRSRSWYRGLAEDMGQLHSFMGPDIKEL
jgi:uracil-DNA glycosylase family 4